MILVLLIVVLMAGGVLSWVSGKRNPDVPRIISLLCVAINLVLILNLFINGHENSSWITEYYHSWMPRIGIHFHLALDGLSLLLLALTYFVGLLAVIISWNEIKERSAFFHFNILWILAGITGVFISMDLFLFYFFWEVMLIPMYFLIAIWGHENRIYASYKFFIFTQASGLLMFIAIIALFIIHGHNTGNYTFDYQDLLGTSMAPATEMLLMGGFLAAFLVKLPVVPFHSWLPDAHTEAPTAGSLILASLMLKTGAYGLLRFVIPLFPHAAATFAPAGMILGIAGILYGAILAFAQTDLKRLVAYTSVNHMGFIVLGVFALNEMAYQGVVMQMIAHGISTGALFIMSGQLYERMHTRDLGKMGGLFEQAPVMGAMGLVFVMASLGLPGLGNFIAEFLTLAGVFKVYPVYACIASVGLVFATLYSIRIMQKVFYGKRKTDIRIRDINGREIVVLGSMTLIIFYLGLFPQTVIQKAKPSIERTLQVKEKQTYVIHEKNVFILPVEKIKSK